MQKITSITNPRVKQVVKLRDRRERNATGLTIIEGQKELSMALKANAAVKEIYVCPDLLDKHDPSGKWEQMIPSYAECIEVNQIVFEKLSYGDRQEGILAVCELQQYFLQNIPTRKGGLIMVVEKVEKPGNLGAILRTCDGAGVEAVILCDPQTDLSNPNVIRASLGTIFTNKVVVATNDEVLRFLKSTKTTTFATSPTEKTSYFDYDYRGRCAFIVGSEQEGLSDFWLDHADHIVQIPMKGQADSLNVASSAALLLYEAVRQRQ